MAFAADKYSIKAPNSPAWLWATPMDFTLRGSNDSFATSDVLDTRTGENTWLTDEVRSYTIAVPANYRAYRLYVTDTKGHDGTGVAVQELEFYVNDVAQTVTMTTNVLPSPVVASAHNEFAAGYEAFRAFDKAGGDAPGGWSSYADGTHAGWLGYDSGVDPVDPELRGPRVISALGFYVKLGDDAGSEKFVIQDSADNEVFAVDSLGAVTPDLSGQIDHGSLIGLDDDDHGQYFNEDRGDDRYSLISHTHDSFQSNDGWDFFSYGDYTDWTRHSAAAPIYIIKQEGGPSAADLDVGMRVIVVLLGVSSYFILVNAYEESGYTYLVLYGGTDYVVAEGAQNAVGFSRDKGPNGFPLDPAKWTVAVSDGTARTQATPGQNTWYNINSTSIAIPIGAWKVRFEANARAQSNESQTAASVEVCLSTANNSASDTALVARAACEGASATIITDGCLTRSKDLLLAAATTYYLNARTTNANMASISLPAAGTSSVDIYAVCAYL